MEVEMWRSHFQRMAEGKVHPDGKGNYFVQKIEDDAQTGDGSTDDMIKFVTPTARDLALAKSAVAAKKTSDPRSFWEDVWPTERPSLKRKRPREFDGEKDAFMRPPGIPAYDRC